MNRYLVGLQVGGLMEDPGLRVEDKEIIEEESAEDAKAAYDRKHKCKFYYALTLAGIEGGEERVYHPEFVTYGDMDKLRKPPEPPKPTKEQIALKQAQELIHGVVKDRLDVARIVTEETIRGIVDALFPLIPGISVEVIPDPENKSLITIRITFREECH